MNRREVIKSFSLVPFHALFPSILSEFLAGDKFQKNREGKFFDPEDQELLKEVIDIIIPKTKTSSASELGVHHFLDEIFASCLTKEQKDLMKGGFGQLKAGWKNQKDKKEYLKSLDQKAYEGDESAAWFKLLKQYCLIGFFTSKEGTTQAGVYQKVPEKYIGEITIDENALAHSKTFLKFYI